MKPHWISLLATLLLVLAGCASYQAGGQIQESTLAVPQKPPANEPSVVSTNANSALPRLPAPTIGSVTITNTTATPISSTTSTGALTPDPAFQGLIQQARKDLAKQLSINVEQIEILKVVPAKWPYASLGCPSSDTKNANTPGFQILLMANNEVYAYHSDGINLIGLCTVKPSNEIRTLP